MNKSIKFRLIVMNLIQWAVWGAKIPIFIENTFFLDEE